MSTLKANSYQHVDRASPSIIINSDGSVSISSTVTYEDITSVDAVGVITGRSNADLQNRVNVGSGVSIKAGGLNVTAGISTFGDDVVFTGAAANVTWDKSTDDLIFNDNAKAIFGTSSDGLEIYHDGSQSYIEDSGTGSLRILTNLLHIRNTDNDETIAKFVVNGETELYHNNTKRLTTTTSGISVSDELNVVGLTTIGGDVSIADKIIHTGDTNTAIRFPAADTVTVETAGTERLRITSDGITKFDDYGGTAGKGRIEFGNSGEQFIEGFDTGNAGSGSYLRFGDGSTERFRIDNDGYVGIGTDNPATIVDVRENKDGAETIIRLFNTDQGNTTTQTAGLYLSPDIRATALAGLRVIKENADFSTSGARDVSLTLNSLQNNSQVEGLRIASDGKVLIGTTDSAFSEGYTQVSVGNTTTTNTGITIIASPTAGYSRLHFADDNSGTRRYTSWISCQHSTQSLLFSAGASGSTKLTLNADGNLNAVGIVTATQFVPTENQTGGFKNLIINGDAQVAQYGTSISVEGYACDRFNYLRSGINEELTLSQHTLTSGDTGPWAEGLRSSIHLENGDQTGGAGASDYTIVRYKVEARDLANSGWDYESTSSYITLSYWIKSSVAQNFYSYLRTHDGTAQIFTWETGALSANTWKKVIVRMPGASGITFDNDNGIGAMITFSPYWGGTWTDNGVSLDSWRTYNSSLRAPDYTTTWWTTNNATMEITGVQLEVGSEPTPFEHITYAQQLRRCQRYYFKDTNTYGNAGWSYSMAGLDMPITQTVKFPVTMRTTPSVTQTNTNFRDNSNNVESPNINSLTPSGHWYGIKKQGGSNEKYGFTFDNFVYNAEI